MPKPTFTCFYVSLCNQNQNVAVNCKGMSTLKNRIKNSLWKYWMYQGMKKLKREDRTSQKIHRAIRETLRSTTSPEEKQIIAEIEKIRNQFTDNQTLIPVTDFGAGDPNSHRTQEEMEAGVTHSATYAEISVGSKPPLWAFLLFKLIREFKPEKGIELGTCLGISASYEASALRMNGKGTLTTLEGSEKIADTARKNLHKLALENTVVITGRFSETLPSVLQQNKPVDYVFIDGHHDENATWEYYQLILPFLAPNALLVFDDITWSKGMKKVWKKIKADEHISLSVDLKMLGICLVK